MDQNTHQPLPESEIIQLLLGGDRRSIGQSEFVAKEVLAQPSLLEILVPALDHSSDLVRMRAADALEKISRVNISVVSPYQMYLLGLLDRTQQAEVKWHLAQIIPRFAWNVNDRQYAFGVFKSWLNDASRIVRTFALQALADLAESDKNLRQEVSKYLVDAKESSIPALRSRANKILSRWEKRGC